MKIWPFNRKKKVENEALPDEVKEYYESGRKQQTGMAWLLAFGTLVVTVVLALIIFFGGRWVYQRLTDNDQPEAPVKEQPAEQNTTAPAQNKPEDTNANNDQQGTSSATTNTPSTATNGGSTTPSTGSSATEVPNTGPGPEGLQ